LEIDKIFYTSFINFFIFYHVLHFYVFNFYFNVYTFIVQIDKLTMELVD